MSDSTALGALLWMPAAASVLLPLVPSQRAARWLTLGLMLLGLTLALSLFMGFDGTVATAAGTPGPAAASWQLVAFPSIGVSLRFALDGLNVYLMLLTSLLFPIVLLCAWNSTEGQRRLYLSMLLLLQSALLGTFLTQNLLVLFALWEAVLVPMVLLILVFGGERRRQAALTFFLYTMAGSVLFLTSVIVLGVEHLLQTGHWSFELEALRGLVLGPRTQTFVFWGIVLACAIKSPLFPFHSWLPLAYGEASPSGTALMAGVMSKMGAFGLMKLAIPLCPDVAPGAAPFLVLMAAVSIVYGAVLALRQQNPKQLLAYASLSHMGYIVLGVFSFQHTAAQGALVQILSHGLAVAGLFLMFGLLEQRAGAAWQQLDALAIRAPRLAVVMMLFVLASLALPLSSGFTAEFLILLGAFTQGLALWHAQAGVGSLVAALLACTGVVLGATYMLRLARAMVFGDGADGRRLPDLNPREALALAPALMLILWLGVWPAPFMNKVEGAVSLLARPPAASSVAAPRTAALDTGAGAARTVAIQEGSHGR